MKVNPYSLEMLEQKNKVGLEYLKNKLDKEAQPEQSKFLLDYAASVVNNTTGKTLTVDLGKVGRPEYSTEEVISATPELLKIFGKAEKRATKSTDLTGEETVTVTEQVRAPDALTRTADGKIRTVFYKRDDAGNIIRDGEKPITDSYEVIPANEVMSIIGKNFMDKKSLPGAVSFATDELKKYGNNILNYSKGMTVQESPVAQRS